MIAKKKSVCWLVTNAVDEGFEAEMVVATVLTKISTGPSRYGVRLRHAKDAIIARLVSAYWLSSRVSSVCLLFANLLLALPSLLLAGREQWNKRHIVPQSVHVKTLL